MANRVEGENRGDQALPVIDTSDPYYIHPSDNLGTILVSKVFDGFGFGTWKRSMMIALSAKNKIGFINGSLIRPNSDSSSFRNWERCNDMVTSWILNALSKDIAESVLYSSSASEIWNELCTRFGQSNLAQRFSIQKELCTVAQGSDSIATYFARIKRLWDELLALHTVPLCDCGYGQALSKYEQDQKLIQFLMGLNESYNAIRGNILMMNPSPTIGQVYSLLIQEEKQRELNASARFTTDSISFQTSSARVQNFASKSSKQDVRKPSLSCSYCKKPGHSVDKCYRIHGFPSTINSKGRRSSVHSVTSTSNVSHGSVMPGLTQEQYTQLLNLLNKSSAENTELRTCNFAGPFNEESSGSW